MNNILSVFGILLAVFTYIESIYHDDVHKCLEIEVCEPKRSNKLNYEYVEKVIRFKQYSLVMISTIIFLIMLPVTLEILLNSIILLSNGTASYDISRVTIVLINITFAIITFVQIVTLIKLYSKKKKLNYKE